MLRKLNSIVTVAISSSRTLPFLTKQYLNCSSTPTPIPPVFLMEPAAAIVQEPIWTEESHVIAQLLGAYHVYGEEQGQQDQSYEVPSLSWCSSAHAADSNHCFPQSDCYRTSSFLCPTPSHFGDESCGDHLLNYFMVTLNPTEKSSDDWVDSIINNVAGLTAPDHEVPLIKRKPHTSEDKAGNEISNKKRRDSSNVMKSTKKAQFERRQKNGGDEEENNGQTCSSYSSEADTDAFRDLNGGSNNTSSISKTSNPSRKTRANRSPATDPQSLYARKRRERINARLRILQNLVPNGTKVDISTMLEEAVHYVNFLQLQIKFLSSDELWMYAPIAYSGVNIGAELMVSSPQQL